MTNVKMSVLARTVGAALALAVIQPATANITLNWSASSDNGFGLANGTDLPQGSYLRLGTFTNLTFTQISSMNPVALEPYFVEFANSTIGTTFPVDAHFEDVDVITNPSAGIQGLAGSYLYMYASNLTNGFPIGGALQYGIFTMTNNSFWTLPADSPTAQTTIDITDLTDASGNVLLSGALILAGGFGVGTSDTTGAPLFNLELVPEPSAYVLILMGLAFVGALRFRRTK